MQRDTSILTGEENLETLLVLPDFPVFIGCAAGEETDDIKQNLQFDICKDTGVVQIKYLIEPETLYEQYHSEALGTVWEDHHSLFVKFILEHDLKDVLEIGGSNGKLAEALMREQPGINWTIVDPSVENASAVEGLQIVRDFFPSKKIPQKHYDAIVHSHVFEHFYDPKSFLNSCKEYLPIGGKHIFSVPNLYEYALNAQSNVLNFEHTFFLSEEIIDYLLRISGFEIQDKKFYGKHSIFYSTTYTGRNETQPIPNFYNKYRTLFLELIEQNKEMVKKFNRALDDHPGPKYIFGAHVFTQFLLTLGLNESKLDGLLDNSINKKDKRLYGSRLISQLPVSIAKKENPLVILRANAYQQEIKEQLIKINSSVVFCE